jgi:hypothetical protein
MDPVVWKSPSNCVYIVLKKRSLRCGPFLSVLFLDVLLHVRLAGESREPAELGDLARVGFVEVEVDLEVFLRTHICSL